MNRFFKLAVVTVVMTMVFAMPVLAEDRSATMISSESTDQLVNELDAYNQKVMGQVLYLGNFNSFALPNGSHAIVVSKQVKDYDILCCDNHKVYLKNVLSAAQTDLINKQRQYNDAVAQAALYPGYASVVPQAEAQLAAAQQKFNDAQLKVVLAEEKLAKYYAAGVY